MSPPQESHLEPPKSFIFPSLSLPLPSLSHSCVSFSLGLSSLPTLIFLFNLFLVSLFQPPCLQCKCQIEMLYLLYESEVERSPVSPQTRCLKESQGSGPGAQASVRDRGRIMTLRFPGRQPLPVMLLESAPPSTWQVVETQLFRKLLSTSFCARYFTRTVCFDPHDNPTAKDFLFLCSRRGKRSLEVRNLAQIK